MKVVSFNMRELGGGEKRVETSRFVNEKHPFVLCIQETKWNVVNDLMNKSIWGDVLCGYSYQPSIGAFTGLVTVWDRFRIDVWSTMSFGDVFIIKGKVIMTEEEFIIFNLYAPCDLVAERELWERLVPMILNYSDICLCLCGDFNSVRNIEEQKGRSSVFRQLDAKF